MENVLCLKISRYSLDIHVRDAVCRHSARGGSKWLVCASELVPEEGSNARGRIKCDAKGKVFSINPALGNKTSGTYELTKSQVKITYDWNGQKLKLVYT